MSDQIELEDWRQIRRAALYHPALHRFLSLVESGDLTWEQAMEKLVLFLAKENDELRERLLRYVRQYG